MDDIANFRRSGSILGSFYRDSLHVQAFKTLITSLFKTSGCQIETEGLLKIEEAIL